MLQEHEREKLMLTLTLQSLQQTYALQGFSWQRDDADEVDVLDPLAVRTCACRQGHHGHASQPEPTEAEFNAAVREAQVALDDHINSINETLEEVRYAEDELGRDV
eukprot:304062-Chlamydomonas_euryale.AAC.15